MADTAVAKRYGLAIFDIAKANNSFDAWLADLSTLEAVLGADDLRQVAESGKVPFDSKRAIIERTLGASVSPQALNLALLLVQRGRLGHIAAIAASFRGLVNELRGVAEAQVTTAVPLSDADRARVSARLSDLTGKQIILKTQEDPAIIGGLIAKIGDKVLDGSTRTRLIALRQRLAG